MALEGNFSMPQTLPRKTASVRVALRSEGARMTEKSQVYSRRAIAAMMLASAAACTRRIPSSNVVEIVDVTHICKARIGAHTDYILAKPLGVRSMSILMQNFCITSAPMARRRVIPLALAEVYGDFRAGIPGGLRSPLGARALYLYRGGRDTYYRIHGTNDLESIGNSGSAGCIRMFNQDIIHPQKSCWDQRRSHLIARRYLTKPNNFARLPKKRH